MRIWSKERWELESTKLGKTKNKVQANVYVLTSGNTCPRDALWNFTVHLSSEPQWVKSVPFYGQLYAIR